MTKRHHRAGAVSAISPLRRIRKEGILEEMTRI
jgi:hypothetical protein